MKASVSQKGEQMRLLEFAASWCQPCKVQAPILKKWAEGQKDVQVEVVSVESPEGAALASKFLVQSVPTLVFLDDTGNVLAAESGVHDAKRLDSMYEQAQRRANR